MAISSLRLMARSLLLVIRIYLAKTNLFFCICRGDLSAINALLWKQLTKSKRTESKH